MEWRGLVVRDPETLHGQPRVAGTRVPVSVVLDCLAEGMSEADILDAYPTLTAESILACLSFAADLVRGDPTKAGDNP